jgi:predicted nucleic acid-binding Zn ribbon protein
MKSCIVCGKELSGARTKFCSSECGQRHHHEIQKDLRAAARIDTECEMCGSLFTPATAHQKYCGDVCQRDADRLRKSAGNLLRKYGVTSEDYVKMFEAQGGRCAVCGRHQAEFELRLCVDHDHVDGVVRGLLCKWCNFGLGYFRDRPDVLRKAAAYLEDE